MFPLSPNFEISLRSFMAQKWELVDFSISLNQLLSAENRSVQLNSCVLLQEVVMQVRLSKLGLWCKQ